MGESAHVRFLEILVGLQRSGKPVEQKISLKKHPMTPERKPQTAS